jgi:hypothetical protein
MGNLKERIQHEVHPFSSNSKNKDFSVAKIVEGKNMSTKIISTNIYGEHNITTPKLFPGNGCRWRYHKLFKEVSWY